MTEPAFHSSPHRAICDFNMVQASNVDAELNLPATAAVGVYAHPSVEQRFVRPTADGGREAFLLIDGIRCGACALNVERGLQGLAGVRDAEVNFSTHRARVLWDGSRLKLADVLDAVRDSGYGARPYDPSQSESGLENERKLRLRRLGIAGLFGMQIMAISLALYAGDFTGMQDSLRTLLEWASLVLIIPVLAYSAIPFFLNAASDLYRARTGMDVPVSLGLLIAFSGSVYSTLTGSGAIYFDSVAMFVFFLLLARYVEFIARVRHSRIAESVVTAPPAMATRLRETSQGLVSEAVPAAALGPLDRVVVASGETVPADGVLLSGESTLDESLLTGESRPIRKTAGDEVIAGSLNFDSPIQVLVRRAADDTLLANTLRLMERARAAKPPAVQLADRITGSFVAAVLLIAFGVALYWWHAAPDRWLPVTVSVLVITCPCALSLATPAALVAGVSALTKLGIIITRSHALETLARVNRFVFDKTGTLTVGKLIVSQVETEDESSRENAIRIAAGLEQNVSHPAACSIRSLYCGAPAEAKGIVVTPGRGVEGQIDGRRYLIGSVDFVGERLAAPHVVRKFEDSELETVVALADESRVLARFVLRDEPRADAAGVLERLRAMGISLSLLSGDRAQPTAVLASRLGIENASGELLPQQKLAAIRGIQAGGEIVAAVGDGINDAPVLAGADVSFAMAGGPQAARASADLILIRDDLASIAASVEIARRTRKIIAQNLSWAVAYNLLAVPSAALGYVPPWLAAVGMSLSSLIVVGNSLRAGRARFPQEKR